MVEPGRAILEAIREQGRTRKQVYMFLGVSESTFSRWLSGEVDPPVSKALRLSVLLNRPVEQLFGHLLWGRKSA